MWTVSIRPDPRDTRTPCATEIGLTVADAYEAGDTLDTTDSALRCTDLDPFILASLRTDADEAAVLAALDTALATSTRSAEVINLTARRRRATDEQRAA